MNSSFRFLPVKSSIGEISAKSSFNPSRLNHSNESIWTWMRLGISRISGIRAKLTRSGRDAGVLTAMRTELLSPVALQRPRSPRSFPGLRHSGRMADEDDGKDRWRQRAAEMVDCE